MENNLRTLRQDRGWTQQDLAYQAGLSQPTIQLIETGKRNPSAITVKKLAKALGVTPDAIIAHGTRSENIDLIVRIFNQVNSAQQEQILGILSTFDKR